MALGRNNHVQIRLWEVISGAQQRASRESAG
jgi:hypothetical protein